MRSLAEDLKFGLKNEEAVSGVLKTLSVMYDEAEFINTKELYKDYYYPFDFEGTTHKTAVEMKSRRNKKNTYPTTIIPVAKVMTNGVRQLFMFKFTDCITYIEYDKAVLSSSVLCTRISSLSFFICETVKLGMYLMLSMPPTSYVSLYIVLLHQKVHN